MNPEDLVGAPTVEEVLKTPQIGPDGQEKKDLPAIERYYHRLSNNRVGPNNHNRVEPDNLLKPKNEDLFGTLNKSSPRDDRVSQEDSIIPSGVRETVQTLNKLVESDRSDGHFYPSCAASATCPIPSASGTSRCRRSRCRSTRSSWTIIVPSWTRVGTRPQLPLRRICSPLSSADAASSAGKPAVGLPSALSSAPPTAIEVQMDVTSPRLGPAGLPDVNAHALGQTRPTPVLPTSEPTRVAPPAPTFAVPKRSFY